MPASPPTHKPTILNHVAYSRLCSPHRQSNISKCLIRNHLFPHLAALRNAVHTILSRFGNGTSGISFTFLLHVLNLPVPHNATPSIFCKRHWETQLGLYLFSSHLKKSIQNNQKIWSIEIKIS